MKISILGTEYEIRVLTKEEYPKLVSSDANGLAELYSKELIINKDMNPNDGQEYSNFKEFERKVLRHEIVHAFFHESGIQTYAYDETLVDWLALQIPKIYKTMRIAGCIEQEVGQ